MRRSVPAILVVALAAGACAPVQAPVAQAPSALPPAAGLDPVPVGMPAAGLEPSPTVSAAPRATPDLALLQDPNPMASVSPATRPETSTPPTTSPSATPAATPVGRPPARTAVSIARSADFVRQYTFEWCVGASIQMTRSIVTGDREESRASQRRYWEMARARTIGSPYGGANPAGWAAALNDLGLGPYRLVSLPSFDAALTRAARALAETGRPVGLVMWAGRHAWVMTGYEASSDPVRDPDARITRVRVMDPLYPNGSRWGPSPEPNSLIGRKALARQFVLRDRPDYDFGVDPGWLLVLPVS